MNILAELKMERGRFQETVTLIESAREHMRRLTEDARANDGQAEAKAAAVAAREEALARGKDYAAAEVAATAAGEAAIVAADAEGRSSPADIPLDLTVRLGMALLYLGRGEEAGPFFSHDTCPLDLRLDWYRLR